MTRSSSNYLVHLPESLSGRSHHNKKSNNKRSEKSRKSDKASLLTHQSTTTTTSSTINTSICGSKSMMDSVVKGVSKLTMCSSSAFDDMEQIFSQPPLFAWKDYYDDGSNGTISTFAETNTLPSLNNSFSEASQLSSWTTTHPRSNSNSSSSVSTTKRVSLGAAGVGTGATRAPQQKQSAPPLSAVTAGIYTDSLSLWTQALQQHQKQQQGGAELAARTLSQQEGCDDEEKQWEQDQPQLQKHHRHQQQHQQQQPLQPQPQKQTQKRVPHNPLPPTACDLDDEIDTGDGDYGDSDGKPATRICGDSKEHSKDIVPFEMDLDDVEESSNPLPPTACDLDEEINSDDEDNDRTSASSDGRVGNHHDRNKDTVRFIMDYEDECSGEGNGFVVQEEEFLKQTGGYQDRYNNNVPSTHATSPYRKDHANSKQDVIHHPIPFMDELDEPPLSAQTDYARLQLLKSAGYKVMQKQQQKLQHDTHSQCYDYCDDYNAYDDDDDDDDDLLLDEVEMSRELGGYEEGFGIAMLHHLPSTILEEDADCDHDDSSSSSSSSYQRDMKRREAITKGRHDNTGAHNNSGESACVHCRNGSCDFQDCSASRFMI